MHFHNNLFIPQLSREKLNLQYIENSNNSIVKYRVILAILRYFEKKQQTKQWILA